MRVVALVPAYNAVAGIEGVVQGLWRLNGIVDEIVIVNDGSNDRTQEVLDRLQAAGTITVLRHEKNRGYGGAHKTLFDYARSRQFDIAVILHADGQHAPAELPRLLGPLKSGEADFVLGSRALGGNMLKAGMPLYRYVGNRIFTFLENAVFQMRVSTFHCGYKACSKLLLDRLDYHRLTDKFHFDSEFMLACSLHRFRMAEVPVSTIYDYNGSSHVNLFIYAKDLIGLMIAHTWKRVRRKVR